MILWDETQGVALGFGWVAPLGLWMDGLSVRACRTAGSQSHLGLYGQSFLGLYDRSLLNVRRQSILSFMFSVSQLIGLVGIFFGG